MLLKDKKQNNNNNSGVLMHLSALPSPYGIGTLGYEAYRFVDFLKASNQKYWQLLPLVPLGEGNSPYKSSSCYAGEILYLDLDLLVLADLLKPEELPKDPFIDSERINFDKVREFKLPLIKKAAERFKCEGEDYIRFVKDNDFWLKDYAIFAAMLDVFNTDSILDLPLDLRKRKKSAIVKFVSENSDIIKFYTVTQYLFYAQYYDLKRYAKKSGIDFIGDIPIYVSLDSSEVWTTPKNFMLEDDLTPKLVAGVPPDMFSKLGQLWGNPIYDWNYMKKDNFSWWRGRIRRCMQMYDIIRIDHFRAFADYYTIKYGAKDATKGKWVDGPQMAFWDKINEEFGKIGIIAEDLGEYTDNVGNLLRDTNFPNMRVLQFAFSGEDTNSHLPRNYNGNCVSYTGTHDNDTTLGWYQNASEEERSLADSLFPATNELPVPLNLVKAILNSNSKIKIIPIQDWLMQDSSARMNIPGVPKGNWGYRVKKSDLSSEVIERIKNVSKQ